MAYSYKIEFKCICNKCNSIVLFSGSDIKEERTVLGFDGDLGIKVDKVVYCPNCNNRIIIESKTLAPDDDGEDDDKENYYDDYDYSDDYDDKRDDYRDDEYPDYYWDDLDD